MDGEAAKLSELVAMEEEEGTAGDEAHGGGTDCDVGCRTSAGTGGGARAAAGGDVGEGGRCGSQGEKKPYLL